MDALFVTFPGLLLDDGEPENTTGDDTGEETGTDDGEEDSGESTTIEVISVDELLKRLNSEGEGEEQAEEPEQPGEEGEDGPTLTDRYYMFMMEDASGKEQVQLLKDIKTMLEKAELEPHKVLETNFADYTVTEGLLLLGLLLGVVSICWKMLRRGFSWLS